jgi:hypothetical protein
MEVEREAHRRLVARDAAAEALRLEAEAAMQRRELERLEHSAQVVRLRAEAEERVWETRASGEARAGVEAARAARLVELGVGLTEVLVAECRAPDRSIRLEGAPLAGLHLHEG